MLGTLEGTKRAVTRWVAAAAEAACTMNAFIGDIELHAERAGADRIRFFLEHAKSKQSISFCYGWEMGGSAILRQEYLIRVNRRPREGDDPVHEGARVLSKHCDCSGSIS